MIGIQPTSIGAQAVEYLLHCEHDVDTIELARALQVDYRLLHSLLQRAVLWELIQTERKPGRRYSDWRAGPAARYGAAARALAEVEALPAPAAEPPRFGMADWPPGFRSVFSTDAYRSIGS